MKRTLITLIAFFLLSNAGYSQNINININEQINHSVAIEMPMELNLGLDFDFEHEFDFEHNFDFEISEFDFNFEMPIDVDFMGLNNLNDHQGGFWFDDQGRNTDPYRKEISMVISSDEFNNDTEVVIKNINGDVKVSGYNGDDIEIGAIKEVWKKRGNISEEEASEYELKSRMYEGKLYLYVDSPNAYVEFRKGKLDYHWHWDDNDRNRINAHYDLEIKLPKNLAVSASTVNSGDVEVAKMESKVKASNVNGSVTVKDVQGYTTANTVNGDIEVWYTQSPKEDTDFKTVNGTIEIYSPEDLSAVVTMESLHGELYTDFEQVKRLPNRLNKEQRGDGYRYKINNTSPIQFGNGDIEMGFKLVNGDVYIRTRKS